MKFSEKWLREWVNPDIDTTQLSDLLTQAGLEVDAMEPVAGDFAGVLVGQVVSIEPHPDADKLRCCKVDVAGDELLSIVCGAANVRQGLKVPVAVIGAVLPGNFKIKKAKLRGVESFGMLCGASEIGINDNTDGLMELADDAPVGEDFRSYLELDDVAIDVDLTPNRSDCLGIAGIAREVGVLTGSDITQWSQESVEEASNKLVPINIDSAADCPRYLGRVIENINPQAQTPVWMKEKLRRSGVRSISAIVDITNYVMLELGQPMHAFDLAKIDGEIHVRQAKHGEKLELLDGQQVSLNQDTLVIADDNKALAMAGVMGGLASSVTDATQDIVLESAHFNPLAIAGRARRYGLHTDSSHRFERGVDPELPRQAIDRATALIVSIAGGKVAPINEAVEQAELPSETEILLRASRIKRVLGIALDNAEVTAQLQRLGLTVVAQGEDWQVTVPAFRFDIKIEVDLIEELGRLYGYDKLPETRPQGTVLTTDIAEGILAVDRVQSLLVDLGYQEAITYSFVDPEVQKLFLDDDATTIDLTNPISADLSQMRTSLWTGLVQAATYNLNRQQDRVRLFEVGRNFLGKDDQIVQHRQVAGLICGNRYPEQWAQPSEAVDFYDIKADVEALLQLGQNSNISFRVASHPALHPGQSAQIYQDDQAIGWLGAIHPKLHKQLGLGSNAYVFELALNTVLQSRIPVFKPLSKFPAIRRDLALLVSKQVEAGNIEHCLNQVKSDILESFQLFDVYSGAGIDADQKSIAVALHLQHEQRTLTDEEVDNFIKNVMQLLSDEIGATVR